MTRTGMRRAALRAEIHGHDAALNRRAEARAQVPPDAERSVRRALEPLTELGYHVLVGREGPGGKNSRIDFLVIGPAGLFVVDATSWSDLTIDQQRAYRHEVEVTDDLAAVADLAYAVEGVMVDIGLAPGEIHPVIVLAGRAGVSAQIGTVELVGEADIVRHILKGGERLDPARVDLVLAACLDVFPEARPPRHASSAPEVASSPHPSDLAPATRVLVPPDAEPLESWMTFLEPDQARAVRRSFRGPARIRGAAGTGKSVVALHRAAYLARAQPGIVLVTSFVSTLPAVQASLLTRLAPDISSRVEFVGTHAFAKRLLSDRGIPCPVQPAVAETEFDLVWRTVVRKGRLSTLEPRSSYWEDEIRYVIKGHGISSPEEYERLARVGRQRALSIEDRAAVWELYVAYQDRMRRRGAWDEADLILAAEKSLSETPLERYSSVIVDEAGDLSAVMIRMLHHLVGDRPDGLTLIGDGTQTTYPGGYSLNDLGISIAGRGVVLTRNHRNTRQIVEFAESLLAGAARSHPALPGDEDAASALPATYPTRQGDPPILARYPDRATHDADLPRRVRELVAGGVELGDIGILALSTFAARAAIAVLQKANIPIVELTRYDGRPTSAVKVGTVGRAKGLDFDEVMVVQVSASLLESESRADEQRTSGGAERSSLHKRELYVAATRARNGLWLGVIP